MKILHCDCCHVEVNDYAHWYNDKTPRNMYELKCVHETNSDTYEGMIICHKCMGRLFSLTTAESDEDNECKEKHYMKKCPFCGGTLDERVIDNNIHVDYCPKCDAAWKKGGVT